MFVIKLNEVDMFESNQERIELIDSLYNHEYSKIMNRIIQNSKIDGDSDVYLNDLNENDIQITPDESFTTNL